MRSLRLVSRKHLSVFVLPTHFCFGLSLHTITLAKAKIRLFHVHLPLVYFTFSWTVK